MKNLNSRKIMLFVGVLVPMMSLSTLFLNFTTSSDLHEQRDLVVNLAKWLMTSTGEYVEIKSKKTAYLRRYGYARKIMDVKSLDVKDKEETYITEALSSKVCTTLDFLIQVGKSKSIKYDSRAQVKELADLLVTHFQIKSGDSMGGFILSEYKEDISTRTTAYCGEVILKAWEFLEGYKAVANRSTKSPYIESAKLAAIFLDKMRNPNKLSFLKDFKYVGGPNVERENRNLYLDGIDEKGRLRMTSTLWNATAISFLSRLESIVPGSSFTSRDLRDQQIHAHFLGAMKVVDGFTPNFFTSNMTKVNLESNAENFVNEFRDNKWHRRSEGKTEGVGGDPVEYVIVMLNELKRDKKEQDLFNRLNNSVVLKKVPGSPWQKDVNNTFNFDPFIGWTSFYVVGKLNEKNHYEAQIEGDVFFNYSHYDFDAITAETKIKLYPCRVVAAVSRLSEPDSSMAKDDQDERLGELSRWLYASLTWDLKPFGGKESGNTLKAKELNVLNSNSDKVDWDAEELVMKFSKGTSTTAHNGLLLLRAIEFEDSDQIKNCK